jgi:K+-transporting ATPase KdpF subunit
MPDRPQVIIAPRRLRRPGAGGRRLRDYPRTSHMIIDYLIGGAVAVLLLGYLVYALLRPEKF